MSLAQAKALCQSTGQKKSHTNMTCLCVIFCINRCFFMYMLVLLSGVPQPSGYLMGDLHDTLCDFGDFFIRNLNGAAAGADGGDDFSAIIINRRRDAAITNLIFLIIQRPALASHLVQLCLQCLQASDRMRRETDEAAVL